MMRLKKSTDKKNVKTDSKKDMVVYNGTSEGSKSTESLQYEYVLKHDPMAQTVIKKHLCISCKAASRVINELLFAVVRRTGSELLTTSPSACHHSIYCYQAVQKTRKVLASLDVLVLRCTQIRQELAVARLTGNKLYTNSTSAYCRSMYRFTLCTASSSKSS